MGTEPAWRPLRKPLPTVEIRLSASPFSRLSVAHALAVAGDSLVTMALAGSRYRWC